MAAKSKKILFVCMGNICRSPAAENVLNHLIELHHLGGKIECDSAGTIAFHQGEAPDARMTKAASRRGIRMKGRARAFSKDDFKNFDLILTMDKDNYRDVIGQARSNEDTQKVREFCSLLKRYDDLEVPDPYYGGAQGFEHVLDLLDDGCENLLKELQLIT